MKKLFVIFVLAALALSANAQDVYTVGYYDAGAGTIAALYKNGEKLYDAHYTNQTSKATRVTCNSQGDVYWWVGFYDYPEGTYNHSEARINNQVYATTENHSEIRVSDIYCLNDTVYYAGYQYNEDSIMVAMVWKGEDFSTHWVMGDGIHPSYICRVDVDKHTGIPYFCGYVINDKKRAAIWERQELLSTFDEESITYSYASEIAVENGHVYTIGEFGQQGFPISALWKDNVLVRYVQPYFDELHCICTFENSYYYGYNSRWQYYDAILKENNTEVLQLGYAYCILSTLTDIYVIGDEMDYKYYVWKNFEKQYQIENCDVLYDMAVYETSTIPDEYYGFLYQPINATITLDPNSSFGAEYGDFQARFQYYPNGLLYTQRALSVYPNGGGCDYDHTYRFTYDSDLHVIQQNDTYYGDWGAAPYQNRYVYEGGLLMTFTRYYNDYHEDNAMILEDSISYAYDGLRRLQKEERFVSTTSIKNYEYLENVVVITTEGYSSGVWMTLSQETRTFSADSLLLSIQTEKYNDSATLVTYGYDEQGHQTSALTQKRYNGVWENQKLVEYHFNPNGRLTLAEIKLWQENEWVNAHRAIYDLDEMGYPAVVTFEKWNGEAWVNGVWQADFYLYNEDHLMQQNDMLFKYKNYIHKIEMDYLVTDNPRQPFLLDNSEWYYEILNDDGSVTYQHLEYAADTTIGTQRPKIIIRSNTQYDRDTIITEVTHEYIYEENGIVYWWNKDLEAFTMLYDLMADVGDEWGIKVGTDSLTMHVDAVVNYEYDGKTYRMLRVSDENGLFSGDIVSGVGHLTSFFPERLMNRGKGYRVTGLRCYWAEGNLIFKIDRDDCDAIYAELHNGIEEDGPSTPSTGSGTLVVYPNPANNILFVETQSIASLQTQTYHITNLMGQTVLSGHITAENQQIDIANLTEGMYFISIGERTVKFVKQ